MINLYELLVASSETVVTDTLLKNASEVLAHSKICFETIMRLYYLHHGFESSDTYMAHDLDVLAYMANAQLKSTSSSNDHLMEGLDDARSTLILAAKGLNDQGRSYYLPYTLFRVLLEEMDPEDVNVMKTFINLRKEDNESNKLRANQVHAQYPVNIVRMVDNPESRRLSNLMKQYPGLGLEVLSSEGESQVSSNG
jgi:hypothetical protein